VHLCTSLMSESGWKVTAVGVRTIFPAAVSAWVHYTVWQLGVTSTVSLDSHSVTPVAGTGVAAGRRVASDTNRGTLETALPHNQQNMPLRADLLPPINNAVVSADVRLERPRSTRMMCPRPMASPSDAVSASSLRLGSSRTNSS
jgi:hypothetical protein